MWWYWGEFDPKILLILFILLIGLFFGMSRCSDESKNKVSKYDTISKNDSMVTLKIRKSIIYWDTITKNDSIIVLKKSIR